MSGVNLNLSANPTLTYLIVGVVIAAVIAVIAWSYARNKRRRSQRLQQRFGPEYAHTVNELGDRTKAEAELAAREKRVERFNITPLAPADAARFAQAWNELQLRFVDDPKAAVVRADRMVHEVMTKRGYPMGEFERRAAVISVDYPGVVANYRAARAVASRAERGEASTEELRKAVVHYRALFQELLAVSPSAPLTAVAPTPVTAPTLVTAATPVRPKQFSVSP
jgi:hypothetical protein